MASTAPDAPSSEAPSPGTAGRPFQISPLDLAPDNLWQAINPWSWRFTGEQIGLVNISIGDTKHPELERKILDEVGSYGRQLGHIGDALEVLMRLVDRETLKPEARDKLEILEGELAKIRAVKRRELGKG